MLIERYPDQAVRLLRHIGMVQANDVVYNPKARELLDSLFREPPFPQLPRVPSLSLCLFVAPPSTDESLRLSICPALSCSGTAGGGWSTMG